MAKRRRKTGRRRTHAPARKHHKRGRRGGGTHPSSSLLPSKEDLKLFAGAALYGWAEGKAKGDADFILNKVPKPIAALGFAGNTAVILRLGAMLTKNHWLASISRSVSTIACYQLGRKGGTFSAGTEHFQVSGYDDDDVARQIEAGGGGYDMAGLSPSADLAWNEW